MESLPLGLWKEAPHHRWPPWLHRPQHCLLHQQLVHVRAEGGILAV